MTDSAPSKNTNAVPTERAQPSPFDTMLKTAFFPSLISGVLAAAIAFFVAGSKAGVSAGFGAVLALGFFAGGLLVMRRVMDVDGVALMAGAMAVFFGQLILVFLIMALATSALDLDAGPTVIGVVVVVLVWQIFQVLGFIRSRRPVYDPVVPVDEES